MNIPSILRHWFTLAATAATMWLIAALTLSADEGAALTDAFGKLIEPLAVIAALVIAALWRVILQWAAVALPGLTKLFRTGSGETDDNDNDNGSGGPVGLPLWVMIGTLAVLGGLPACSSSGEYPLTGTISFRDPSTGAKAGMTFSKDAPPRATVKVPIYDSKTGEMIGLADLQAELPTVDRRSGK